MIRHFHGTPIWGDKGAVHRIAVSGAGAFVSDYRPDQLKVSLRYATEVALDNGAFSFWNNEEKPDWPGFYRRLEEVYDHVKLKFFVIPDVIVGGEEENDALIASMPSAFRDKAAPTWHLHESIERLVHLCEEWPRVCFGSSGQYRVIRTKLWHNRMVEAFEAIYEKRNLGTRIHGLRMLDGRVLGNYPLDTADSTNLACNVPKFEMKYPEITRQILEADYALGLNTQEKKMLVLRNRCAILKGAIEAVQPPSKQQWLINKNKAR